MLGILVIASNKKKPGKCEKLLIIELQRVRNKMKNGALKYPNPVTNRITRNGEMGKKENQNT